MRTHQACRAAAAWVVVGWAMVSAAQGAATPRPDALPADITYKDEQGKPVTIAGEFVFTAWPYTTQKGDTKTWSIGSLLPTKLDKSELHRKDATYFARGTALVRFAFESFDVEYGSAAALDEAMKDAMHGEADADFLDPDKKAAAARRVPSPVRLVVEFKTEMKELPVAAVQSIIFKMPPDWSGEVTGRFVAYSRKARGANGTIRPVAATFFGGGGEDNFIGAAFLAGGAVLTAGHVGEAAFLQEHKARVIGHDPDLGPPDQGPPAAPAKDGKGQRPSDPRAVVLVRYSADLARVEAVTRLPFGAATISQVQTANSGEVYLGGWLSRHGRSLLAAVDRKSAAAPPDGAADTDEGGFIARLTADGLGLEWIAHFPARSVHFSFRGNGDLFVETGLTMFLVSPQGQIQEGPKLSHPFRNAGRSRVTCNPFDDAFMVGGDFQSSTGREPYRNPWMNVYNRAGKLQLILWNYSGPVVGMDYFRQVSDSSVKMHRYARNGDVVVVGWSDGGNTVLTNSPYDLEKHHGRYGAFNDMSAASVSSFHHILRLDPRTYEVTAGTYVIGYHPISNRPNSSRPEDLVELGDGRWALAAQMGIGLIETPDAWVSPWVVEQARNPQTARPHGGPALMFFDSEFRTLQFSSLVPCLRGMRLAQRGRMVLLAGAAVPEEQRYGSRFEPILAAPAQKAHGGATDGYLMLIDTAARPAAPAGRVP